ncbi:HlyU family transcriptional regulator [Celeribacter litoreus]|uniref:HlyU family transcriptional regulator n=1 Tax=Celeribacter litoreus TaxID=2876714 RepID=UPI001CC9710E|nr:HlyU family transcriptional regulator [Celeribacter litoreus]MCA0043013.1 hypothetical protein [Celeribacter litoreus]
MSLFSKLFGGGSAAKPAANSDVKPELYGADYLIYPDPIKEASGYRVAAKIEKDFDGVTREHHMIRADTFTSEEDARVASLHKAQIFIDQMGEAIFND